MPSQSVDNQSRGLIIPIGGAEKKMRDPEILERFVELCGGRGASIAVIPTASQLADTGSRYQELFEGLGANAQVLPLETREDCKQERYLADLDAASGVFMTGGDQLRLSTTLGGTPIAQAIRRRNAAGMHVAGTSAIRICSLMPSRLTGSLRRAAAIDE